MTFPEINAELADIAGQFNTFIGAGTPATFQAKPTEKWSIAEELLHVAMVNHGFARALAQAPESLRPTAHTPRTHAQLVAQYQATAAQAAIQAPAQVVPGPESLALTPAAAAPLLDASVQALRQAAGRWQQLDADAGTVWKHPVFGPVTARELLLIGAYHARLHLAALHRKHAALSA